MMGDCEDFKRILNPLAFHLQKMEVELKCPLCLNLLSRPLLLPCDHMFCRHCITKTAKNRSDCPACRLPFIYQDLRDSSHMETMVNIYRSMNAALGANFVQQGYQLDISETGIDVNMPSSESPVSSNLDAVEILGEERMQNMAGEKLSSVHSMLSLFGNTSSQRPRDAKINEFALQLNGNYKKGHGAFINQEGPKNPALHADLKDSDNGRGDQGSKHSTENLSAKGLMRKVSSTGLDEREKETERVPKRHKLGNQSYAQDNKYGIVAKGFSMSSSDSEVEMGCHPSFLPWHTSSASDTDVSVQCVFCHSSRTSEAFGRMLHFLNGNPILADQVCQPNVFHVHEKCVDWAPQVYFEGENAMNLEAEVSRAAKIKCSSCRRKGAALGCYVRSCRKSYHVPCALGISDCRWDIDNFVMLCPSHSSHKLPCDKRSKKKTADSSTFKINSNSKEDLTSSTKQQLDGLWTDPLGLVGDWALCGSALCNEDKELLERFETLTGTPVAKAWKQNFTHVIASTDERGACNRTLKIFTAILTGKWVLSINWIRACMEAGHPVPEEPYEISYDVLGSFDGPRNGRIRVMQKAPKLFAGLKFCFSGYYMPYYKNYLEDLITIAGGTILHKNGIHISQDSSAKEISPESFIIYSVDPPQGCNPEDLAEAIKKRALEAEELAAQTGSRAIRHTWLLDSIAACSLQPDQ